MSLLKRLERNRLPRAGEQVRVYQHERLIARGQVIAVDHRTISIAGNGLVDLDTEEMRRGLNDGSVRVERDAS